MFFPKGKIEFEPSFKPGGDVYLESGHICIKKNVAEKIFGTEQSVFSIYYPTEKTFLTAPQSEEGFKTIHKASSQMLKNKNAAGDRSLSVQEVLLDNDLDNIDRDLEFIAEEALRILKVKL